MLYLCNWKYWGYQVSTIFYVILYNVTRQKRDPKPLSGPLSLHTAWALSSSAWILIAYSDCFHHEFTYLCLYSCDWWLDWHFSLSLMYIHLIRNCIFCHVSIQRFLYDNLQAACRAAVRIRKKVLHRPSFFVTIVVIIIFLSYKF